MSMEALKIPIRKKRLLTFSSFLQVGASFPIEIEKLSETKSGAVVILRCPAVCYIKVRSSITLLSSYQSQPCACHISRVGTNLLELLNSPRKIAL